MEVLEKRNTPTTKARPTMKSKQKYRDSLSRMGVPIFPGDKILKKDILQLPFQSSGVEVLEIRNLGIEKQSDSFVVQLHLVVTGGDKTKVKEVYEKNKEEVEKALGAFAGAYTNKLVDRAALELKSSNDENIWVNVKFYYNLDDLIKQVSLDPFCYRLYECE